jgi:hypothetical protein
MSEKKPPIKIKKVNLKAPHYFCEECGSETRGWFCCVCGKFYKEDKYNEFFRSIYLKERGKQYVK